MADDAPPPTLLEWAGGECALGRMIDCSYDRVERAPVPRWGWGEAPPYKPLTQHPIRGTSLQRDRLLKWRTRRCRGCPIAAPATDTA